MIQSVSYNLEDISKMMKVLNCIQISGVENFKAIAVVYDILAQGKAIQYETPAVEESGVENFRNNHNTSEEQRGQE